MSSAVLWLAIGLHVTSFLHVTSLAAGADVRDTATPNVTSHTNSSKPEPHSGTSDPSSGLSPGATTAVVVIVVVIVLVVAVGGFMVYRRYNMTPRGIREMFRSGSSGVKYQQHPGVSYGSDGVELGVNNGGYRYT